MHNTHALRLPRQKPLLPCCCTLPEQGNMFLLLLLVLVLLLQLLPFRLSLLLRYVLMWRLRHCSRSRRLFCFHGFHGRSSAAPAAALPV